MARELKEKLDCVTNAHFIHCNSLARKVWMAKITGTDKKYYLSRDFLPSIGYDANGMKQFDLTGVKPCVVEVSGGSWKNKYYTYLIVTTTYVAEIRGIGSLPSDAKTRKRILQIVDKLNRRDGNE